MLTERCLLFFDDRQTDTLKYLLAVIDIYLTAGILTNYFLF